MACEAQQSSRGMCQQWNVQNSVAIGSTSMSWGMGWSPPAPLRADPACRRTPPCMPALRPEFLAAGQAWASRRSTQAALTSTDAAGAPPPASQHGQSLQADIQMSMQPSLAVRWSDTVSDGTCWRLTSTPSSSVKDDICGRCNQTSSVYIHIHHHTTSCSHAF